MLVGWQLATHMRSSLVVDALEMAVGLRQPAPGGLVAHTDRGSQYTGLHYTDRLDEHGIAPSVGSRGEAYDNAMAEAFAATYKSELVDASLAGRILAGTAEGLTPQEYAVALLAREILDTELLDDASDAADYALEAIRAITEHTS